jgi:hypothetical protein
MKKISLLVLFILLVTFTFAEQSQMKFKETTIDFGDVESGKVVDVNFEFENAGDSVLIIKNISTSCGCTAAKLEKREYAPGEKGTIPVKFNTRGYNGRVTKTITIATNDKDKVYTHLKIVGKITLTEFAAIELAPDKIDFEKVKLNETYSKKIGIRNTGTQELRIIEVQHSPEITAEFTGKTIKPGEEMTVKINFRPMQEGRFTTFLKVRSNAYRQRMVILRVSAEIETE